MVTTADQYDIIIPSGNRFLSSPFNIMATKIKVNHFEEYLFEAIADSDEYLSQGSFELTEAQIHKIFENILPEIKENLDARIAEEVNDFRQEIENSTAHGLGA